MPRIEFARNDLHIQIVRARNGDLEVKRCNGTETALLKIPAIETDVWLNSVRNGELLQPLPLAKPLANWIAAFEQRPFPPPPNAEQIWRVTVEIHDLRLAAVD